MGTPSIVTWDSSGGIATKNAPLMLQPNSSLLVDNLRQERKGEWRSRAGTDHNVLDDLLGLNPPVMAISTPNGGFFALCRQTDDTTAGRIYTKTGAPRWHAPPTDNSGNQLCAQTTPGIWSRSAVSPMKAQPSAWSAAQGGGIRLTAWWSDAANNGIQVSLAASDGTSLFYSSQFTGMADAVRPRCVFNSTANTLTMFYAESSTGLIFTTTWSCATGLVTVAPRILETDGFVGVDCFVDAIYYGGATVTLVYRNNANQLGFVEYNPATDTTTAALAVTSVDTTKCLALLPDPDASGVRYLSVTTSVPSVRVVQLDSAGTVIQDDLANAAFDAVSISGVAYQSTSGTPGWMIVYWSPGATPELKAVKKRNGTIGANFSLTPSSFTQLIGLASNAWREPGTDAMRFLMYLHGNTGDLQDNYYEMALEFENGASTISNNWPEPQARLLPLNAGTGHESRAGIPQVQRLGPDNYLTCLPRITRNEIVANVPSIDYGIDTWTVQYLNATTYTGQNQGPGTNTQQCAYLLAGSLLQTATGQLPCAHGASALPFKPVPTPGTGGALTANATYNYVQTVELADEAGNTWASDPSNPVEITLGAGQGQISLEFQNTPFENQARLRTVKLWATAGNGSEYFLLFATTDTIANTVDLVFVHNITDAVLEGGEPIGGELQGTITPAMAHVVMWSGRLWGVPRDFPTQVWFSKPIAQSTSPVFPDNFLVDTDDGRGPLTGLAAMDNVIVAFKQSAIYVNSTLGPANDGTGTYPTFQLVESANGAIAGSPMAVTGAEVYFQALGGIWRVKSSQATDFVGAPIDAYLSMPLVESPESVYGMVVVPEKNEVRIQMTNYRFVHDTVFDVWERDTGGMNAGIVLTRMLGTKQAMFLANGQMWVEAQDSNTPADAGTAFAGSLRSPWMRPSNMEGWLHLYKIRALGECLAAGTNNQPTLTIFFDNSNSLSESFQPRTTLTSAVGPVRADAKPRKQLCTAFSPQLTLPTGNASIRFDAWSALVSSEPAMQGITGADNWAPAGTQMPMAPPCPECTPLPIYPSVANTWRTATVFNALHANSAQDDSKDFVWQFTTQMISFGWTVKGSSDSVTGALDGVNRLVTFANWIRPGITAGPFSWLCLQNGSGAEVIFAIDTDSTGFVNWTIRFAPGGGYTGGSTTSTPTAATDYAPTDASRATIGSPFNGGSTGIGGIHRMVARVQVTSDVKHTRILCMFNGVLFCMMGWEPATRPVTGWANPNFTIWDPGGDNPAAPTTPIAYESQWRSPFKLFPVLTSFAMTQMPLFTEIEGTNLAANESSVEVFPNVNALSGLYEIPGPPALVNYDSYSTSGQMGRHASMIDIYPIPYGKALGSSWPPGSSDNKFNVFGNFILPGDGNAVITA